MLFSFSAGTSLKLVGIHPLDIPVKLPGDVCSSYLRVSLRALGCLPPHLPRLINLFRSLPGLFNPAFSGRTGTVNRAGHWGAAAEVTAATLLATEAQTRRRRKGGRRRRWCSTWAPGLQPALLPVFLRCRVGAVCATRGGGGRGGGSRSRAPTDTLALGERRAAGAPCRRRTWRYLSLIITFTIAATDRGPEGKMRSWSSRRRRR